MASAAALGNTISNSRSPRLPGRRARGALARPGVEAEVVVVAARRDEQGARVAAHHDVEAERAGVEGLGRGQVTDVEVDVADPGALGHRGVAVLAAELAEHAVEVERQRVHLEDAVAERPLFAWPVAVELDSVALRVAQIEGLADQMVGGAAEPPAGLGDSLQGAGEVGAGRDEDRQVEEPARPAGARRGLRVADELDDGRPRWIAAAHAEGAVRRLDLGEPDRVAVEVAGAVQIADRQPHGTHRGARIDRAVLAHAADDSRASAHAVGYRVFPWN